MTWYHPALAQRALDEGDREVAILRRALEKLRSYNVDIAAGRINYRPEDHIEVIDRALAFPNGER